MPQDLRLEHVDAGVDGVGEDLAPGGLLEETLDPAGLVGDDDPELERVGDALERERRNASPLAVEADEVGEVDVAEGIARDHEEGLVERLLGELDRAGRAGGRLLHRVADGEAVRLAGAEVAADRLRHEGDGDDDVLEAVLPQELDDVLHARLADDRHHRLRLIRGERAQAGSLSPRHDDGLHRRPISRRRAGRVREAGRDGEPEARPEEPERPVGALLRDQHGEERGVQDPGGELAEEAHGELVAPPHRRRRAEQDDPVAHEDHRERDPRQPPLDPEEDDGGVDHEAVGQRVGELAELGLDPPAAREPAVHLVGDAGRSEDDRRRDAVPRVGVEHEHDEHGDEPEPEDRQRVRKPRKRSREPHESPR